MCSAVRQSGGEVWFGWMAVGAVVEGKKLRGLVVVTPDGQRGVVLAKAVIDATSNADAAALYRLGDKAGKDKTILNAYAENPRGFCANYARRVSAERMQ